MTISPGSGETGTASDTDLAEEDPAAPFDGLGALAGLRFDPGPAGGGQGPGEGLVGVDNFPDLVHEGPAAGVDRRRGTGRIVGLDGDDDDEAFLAGFRAADDGRFLVGGLDPEECHDLAVLVG